MPSFDTIAPELRLQIYGEVLRFELPLARTMHKEESDIRRTHKRPLVIADTAILCVSRKVHQEATPVFYKLNSICVTHTDVCVSGHDANTTQSCDEELVVKAQLTVYNSPPCSQCFHPKLPLLLQQFTEERFPKLESVCVEVPTCNISSYFNYAIGAFTNMHIKTRYTGLAKINVEMPAAAASRPITFTIHVAAATTIWEDLVSLQRKKFEEEDLSEDPRTWSSGGYWFRWSIWLELWARIYVGLPIPADYDFWDWNLMPMAALQADEITSDTCRVMTGTLMCPSENSE
ncbi:hypothetical protein LTS10_001916 [Elasticomyces elasticus]|nr:hypothetical protein LTS10_001916 [Elasticomyces elasticus]